MDNVFVVVIGLVLFVVGLWTTIGIMFLDGSDGEIFITPEDHFVRVDAEQKEVEDFVDRWCEFEEFTSENSNECVVLKGMEICAAYYVPEKVWRRC